MRSLILAAIAAMFVLAPVQAADKPSDVVMLTPEQCKVEMDKCGADQACKAELATKGCQPTNP